MEATGMRRRGLERVFPDLRSSQYSNRAQKRRVRQLRYAVPTMLR